MAENTRTTPADPPSPAELPSLIDDGLRMVGERLRVSPDFTLYQSIRNQLEYLRETLQSGIRPTDEKIDSLTLGVYAAREFETSDPAFADVLFKVYYLANRLATNPAPVPTAPPTSDLRPLLEQRLGRMEVRRGILAALFMGTAGLILGLSLAGGPNGVATRVVVIAFVIGACFFLYGVWLLYQVATNVSRHRRLFQILDHEPERVLRIYGALLIRTGRSAFFHPIRAPEADNLPGPRDGPYVVVQLAEPSRLRRLLGLHEYVVRVQRNELLPLLAYLRGLAPEAQGPPGQLSRT